MSYFTDTEKAIAESLHGVGQSCRVSCCAYAKTAIITHRESGYSFHCFRCGESKFLRHGIRSIAKIAKARSYKAPTSIVELPEDCTTAIPAKYQTWYTQYGISPELAEQYQFMWSPDMHRIVIPVFHNDALASYQARAMLPDQQPKYLTPSAANVAKVLYFAGNPQSNFIVLTEDILSAIKIGRVAYAASIMGTEVTPERAMWLYNSRLAVYVWLDPDAPGQSAAKKILRKLRLYGVICGNIVSTADPKKHSLDEIREYIKGCDIA